LLSCFSLQAHSGGGFVGGGLNRDGGYAQRANDSLSIWNAEPTPPPSTNYADVKSGLTTPLKAVHAVNSNRTAAFVSRIPRMLGLVFNLSWGAVNQGANTASLPHTGSNAMDGIVRNTMFQQVLVQLHDWQTNRRWYINYPMAGAVFMGSKPVRYTYPSFRTQQVNTNVSGGPGQSSMTPRNRYTAVQRVPKYNVTPRFYSTTSAMKGGNRGTGYSVVNGPGV